MIKKIHACITINLLVMQLRLLGQFKTFSFSFYKKVLHTSKAQKRPKKHEKALKITKKH